jgi:hypothetical protein
MKVTKWVLLDRTRGAKTKDGAKLSPEVLLRIAEAVTNQLNQEFAQEWGGQVMVRVGTDPKDIQPGEWAFGLLGSVKDPDASAYHTTDGKGVPFARCAVGTCDDLYGPNGVSVDISHEVLETAGDQGANLYAHDGRGTLHAVEMCDAVETQTYTKTCVDGTKMQVSNWLLPAWFVPESQGPYDYMTKTGHPDAVAPPGPLRTAKGKGGNYQVIYKAGDRKEVYALAVSQPRSHIKGTRRKGKPDENSRTARRLALIAKMGAE